MSALVTEAVRRIRANIGDRNPNNYAVPGARVESLLITAQHQLLSEVGMGTTVTPALVTVVAGTDTYTITVPGSKPGFLYLYDLILASQNWQLEKRDREWIQQARTGEGVNSGPPTDYAIVESGLQVLTLELWPRPLEADTINAVWAELPYNISYEQPTIGLNTDALEALYLRTSALVGASLTPKDAEKVGFNTAQVGLWLDMSRDMARQANWRLHQWMRQDRIELVSDY